MDFFIRNHRVIAVEQLRTKGFSSGTLLLPPSLQTFFLLHFYNALDTFAPKIKFLA